MEYLGYKEQFIRLFPSSEPNKPVIIKKDRILVKNMDETISNTLNADIRIDLLPKPRIHICIPNTEELDVSEKLELYSFALSSNYYFLNLKSNDRQIKAFVTSIQISDKNEPLIIFSPTREPIIGLGDEDSHMQYVIFHLFNFRNIRGKNNSDSNNINLEAENWIIKIKALSETEKNFERLKKEGGYALTHIGCLRKKDNSLISVKEVREIFLALEFFLSFAKGDWCNPIYPVGFDSLGDRVWELWSAPRDSCPHRNSDQYKSWFSEYHAEQIESLFPGFMNRWNDKEWNETLQKVIYWYLNANNSKMDAGIILAQSALERLSFQYFKGKSYAPCKSAASSFKLRKLFSCLGFSSIAIPENTVTLKMMGEKWKWDDSPHALTEIRNYLVHPENKYSPDKLRPAVPDAWNLGLWFLENSLLNLCGYSEKTYYNRLNTSGWSQDIEEIPWEIGT